jgi:hypothetical protein
MSNISGQLIKNSYDYVLQSDLITGVVYRIGGSVPFNPKFTSGLTVNASFTYADGSEFPGYVLTCDALGNATWAPSSATTSGIFVTGGTFNYTTGTLQLVNSNGSQVTISGLTDTYVTGGTISGTSIVFSYNDTNTFQVTGITPYNLFSSYTATTQPLILNAVTGGTFSGSTLYLINNSGATIPITGFTTGSNFTGGTVSGPTNFTSGLTANTISATTYYNLPVSAVTNGFGISASTSNGTVIITNTAPDQTVTISGGTNIQITGTYPDFGVNFTGTTSGDYLPLSGGTVTGGTIFQSGLTANTISATTYYNLPTDVYVTGGTYSAGTATFTNNTGGTFDVTGFSTTTPFTGGTVSGATNFTNGLTANTISATTYYNLPIDVFVTGGTYTSGNAIFTNNTGGTFTVSGFATGGGGGKLFYLNISQAKGTNRYLSTTASTAAEQSTGVTIANGATGTIASFQSDQLNTTLIPGGVWAFYLHSYKQNNNASFDIFVEVYKRTSGGTQTLLFTTDPAPVTTNSPNPSMQLSDGYFSGSSILVSDSIVAVVRATNTSNQSHVITLFSEGSQHYSYAVSSIPTQQGLTCDTLSGCSIIQTIETNITNLNNNKFDKTGGTISGDTIIQSGLTANTISATTYQNLPVSGISSSTYINVTPLDSNFTISLTGPLLSYYVTGSTPSGVTLTSGDRWLDTTSGDELVWVDDGDSQQWIQISSVVGGGGNSTPITITTLIASNSCLITSSSLFFIGSDKYGGWSFPEWDLDKSSYDYTRTDCLIPIPKTINEGETIKVCGVVYTPFSLSESFNLELFKVSCVDLNKLTSLTSLGNQSFDFNGNLCFSLEYTLGVGETLNSCTDFIAIGFYGSGTGELIRISYTINSTYLV